MRWSAGATKIAVGDAFLMRGGHGVRKRYGNVEESIQSKPMLRQELRQGLPLHELHGNEVDVVVLLHRAHMDDVRMIERSDGFGFSGETGAAFHACGKCRRKDLESDLAIQLGVFGQIDVTHPARANLLQDLVVREGLSDHGLQSFASRNSKVTRETVQSVTAGFHPGVRVRLRH